MNQEKTLMNWHEAYREVAERLHDFQKVALLNKEETVSTQLFNRLNTEEFRLKNKWFVRGIEKWSNSTLDPIQIFASFSHSKSSERSRYQNLRIILELLESDVGIDEYSDFFEGCPTVMMSRPVTTRGSEFQEEIWAMFNTIMSNKLEGLQIENFMLYKGWYGIELVSFTIFLFWIDSDNFIPLDVNTRTFMIGIGKWKEVPYDFTSYKAFCNSVPDPEIFRDIVKIAYQLREGRKDDIIYRTVTSKFLDIESDRKREESISRLLHPFRIIAIQPKQKSGHCKNLQEQFYRFYNDYSFVDEKDNTIRYKESMYSRDLFKQDEIDIQVSAIVGKNGSGKSTLSELLYLAINALSNSNKQINEELIKEKAYLNVYFFSLELYKICIIGHKVEVYKYNYSLTGEEEVFTLEDTDIANSFNFNSFFYTVGINYSLYGLNENILGSWINPLFHKNDSYQVPVVLNPKREEGNIEVNTEEHLSKSRLLAHILDLDKYLLPKGDITIEIDEENGRNKSTFDLLVPELVEKKRPKGIIVHFDTKKFNALANEYGKYSIVNRFVKGEGTNVELSIKEIFKVFWERLGSPAIKAEKYRKPIENYIVYKLFSIGETYKRYNDFINVNAKEKKIEFIGFLYVFLDEVLKDTSHVTFKLWQAIHYLIYGHIKSSPEVNESYSIFNLALEIDDVRRRASENSENKKRYPDRRYDAILFIPPSIFVVDIEFEDGHLFSGLSSGEKQSIFAINTVAYHLYNLDSIDPGSGLITYQYVNILFDEVELYFHPDMQRSFVYDLLHFLKGLNLDRIRHLNIQFITHSPFILSDIPETNVLRIEDGRPNYALDQQTFGSNIHDLLRHDFFLKKGFMGEFARHKIESLIEYLAETTEDNKRDEKWTMEIADSFIELIGEPYLKSDLRELYKVKQNKELNSLELIDLEIRRLEKIRDRIKEEKDDSDTFE